MLHLDKSRIARNEQGGVMGTITPFTDEHGNKKFYTTSEHRVDDEVMFWTETAAWFWLDVVDETTRAQIVRNRRG